MPDQNALIPQADSAILTSALSGLQDTLFTAAEANIRGYLGDEVAQSSALQMRAMVATEALRLTTGMDLSTIITRGTIIRQIEEEGLVGVHPNGFANLTALAAENGVSVGELSDIRALWDVIFPYITDVLGQNHMTKLTPIPETTPMRAKLTRSFLEELPEGYFLMSNTCSNFFVPCFLEKVSPKDMREEQWQRIKAAGVDQGTCTAFKGSTFHEKLLSALEKDDG